jgi:ribosome modulation factor
MAQQDILRKYLDILNESTPAQAVEELLSLDQVSAPSESPVRDLLEAIAAFKSTQPDLEQDTRLDPKTLARIMSLSKVLENDMGSMPPMGGGAGAGDAMAPMPAPMPMEESIQDTLRKKAALHKGYSHGLMGDSHTHCSHKEGTPEHMHWHHGYSEGLKECSGVWKMPGTM